MARYVPGVSPLAALAFAAVLFLAALPAQPREAQAQSASPGHAKGRAALLDVATDLARQAADLAGVLSQEQATCGAQREKAKDCGPELLESLARLRAVMLEMDELAKQIHMRLADLSAEQGNEAAMDAFLRLRIAPAAERLASLAADARRDLQLAKAARQSRDSKLPAPNAKAKPDPRLETPISVPPEAKVLPPPPPPPQRLLAQCKKGEGKACLDAAGIYEARRQVPQAMDMFKRACQHGEKLACAKVNPPKAKVPPPR